MNALHAVFPLQERNVLANTPTRYLSFGLLCVFARTILSARVVAVAVRPWNLANRTIRPISYRLPNNPRASGFFALSRGPHGNLLVLNRLYDPVHRIADLAALAFGLPIGRAHYAIF